MLTSAVAMAVVVSARLSAYHGSAVQVVFVVKYRLG